MNFSRVLSRPGNGKNKNSTVNKWKKEKTSFKNLNVQNAKINDDN